MAIKASLAAALVLLAAAGIVIARILRPSYPTARFSDAALSLDYPASWEAPAFSAENDMRATSLASRGRSPFDTRWDDRRASLLIVELPAGKAAQPRDLLKRYIASARAGYPSLNPSDPSIDALRLGGVDAVSVTVQGQDDVLDIGEEPPGVLRSLYRSLLLRNPSWRHIALRGKSGKLYEISYELPGDRLARMRYCRVYERMLDSLQVN